MRRRATIATVTALLVVSLVAAQAQESDDAVLTDPEGDAQLGVFRLGDDSPTDIAVYPALDLRAFGIEETEDQFTFNVDVAGLKSEDQPPGAGEGRVTIEFIMGRTGISSSQGSEAENSGAEPRARDRFRMELDHWDGGAEARLMKYDSGREEFVPYFYACPGSACDSEIIIDEEAARWQILIPRDTIQDADGATPNPSLPLHHFIIKSFSTVDQWWSGESTPADQMPDDGLPAGEFVPALGLETQRGHLLLSSAFPVRWSNGEERSYVYHVLLENQDLQDDEVYLDITEPPMGWQVQLPADSLVLGGGETTLLSIILKTPFGHEHGEFESFVVQARSAIDEDALGQVELGIRYSTVPQPTGHHSRLWVHAAEDSGGVDLFRIPEVDSPFDESHETTSDSFMTALAPKDQPGSIDAWIRPWEYNRYSNAHESRWGIPLEPAMNMGLDFNLTETGTVSLDFISEQGMDASWIAGKMFYRHPNNPPGGASYNVGDKALGTFRSSEKVELPAGEVTRFTATFYPAPEADYIPHNPDGAFVFIDFSMRTGHGGENDRSDALMVPGGTIDLPLDEYHDNLELGYRPLNDVSLVIRQEDTLKVNPGESRLVTVDLANVGIAHQRFGLIIDGPYGHWATILDDTVIDVQSNGNHTVHLVVSAPKDAWDDERAGLVLRAISQNDPYSRAEVRVIVEVDTDDDHPDESSYLVDSSDVSNGPAVSFISTFAISMALLGAALMVRRRP